MDKLCYKCQLSKSIDKFAINKTKSDGHCSQCRECQQKYRRNHYIKNKRKYIDKAKAWDKKFKAWYKTLKIGEQCKECGEKDIRCLDYHHIDPHSKITAVARMASQGSKKRILKEISKCIVICANCHRKHHCT